MAARKKKSEPKVATKSAGSTKAPYKIETNITKPKPAFLSGKTIERQTIEKLKVGQSFAVNDKGMRQRLRDICYRLKLSDGKQFSVVTVETGLRVWRDK